MGITAWTRTYKFDLPHAMRKQQAVGAKRAHFGTHLTKHRLCSIRTCQTSFATGTLHLWGEEEGEERKKIEISLIWFCCGLNNFLLDREEVLMCMTSSL